MDFSANATTIMRTKMQLSTKSDKLLEPLVVKLTIRIPKTPSKTTQQKKKMRHMLKHLHLHRMYWTSWPLLSLHFSHLWCPTIHKLFEKRACETNLLLMTHPGFLSREECFPNLKICDWMKNKYEIIIYYGKQQSGCVSMVKKYSHDSANFLYCWQYSGVLFLVNRNSVEKETLRSFTQLKTFRMLRTKALKVPIGILNKKDSIFPTLLK